MSSRRATPGILYGLLVLLISSLAYGEGVETVPAAYQPLIQRLTQDGFDPQSLSTLFVDSRAEPIPSRMSIRITSGEVPDLYTQFLTAEAILSAKRFLRENSNLLGEMGKGFEVDQEVVVAILLVESRFGENIGKWRVVPTLASMAISDSPENLQASYEKLLEADPSLSYERVEEVARRRANWAYQELKCFLKIIREEKTDPLEVRGSYAGALGMAQFVPSSYLAFAWSNKGLDHWLLSKEESIFSIANYLKVHGWKKNLTLAKKKRVLWHYNRSEPYIDTIFEIAKKLKPEVPRRHSRVAPFLEINVILNPMRPTAPMAWAVGDRAGGIS
jgi:membrane-bound lytic murein transglycosylase B